jgi:hypothetical protein
VLLLHHPTLYRGCERGACKIFRKTPNKVTGHLEPSPEHPGRKLPPEAEQRQKSRKRKHKPYGAATPNLRKVLEPTQSQKEKASP